MRKQWSSMISTAAMPIMTATTKSSVKQVLAFLMLSNTGDLPGHRRLVFKFHLHRVKDGAGAISGNRNVNTEGLAGCWEQQCRDVPAGICCPLGCAQIQTQADRHWD